MSGRVIRIERVSSRSGVVEEPAVTTRGYQLADPAHGKHKHYLRVYLESGNPDTYALIDAAGKASGYICEGCGCHSTISSRGGWLTTLCDDCFSRTK